MPRQRAQQITELIKVELGKLFARETPFPREYLVTITEVQLTDDLGHATIKVSVLPSSGEADVERILAKQLGHMRHHLSRQLPLRKTPQLTVRIDRSAIQSERIDSLLDKLKEGE